ncbi:MAG: hypothetical protein HOH19_01690 [Kordiimonadaceae bacterium]|jgi:hypothetical protein|nr:hypothetical protein [Kordiimonadaceae bacterium]MBT6031261.1 hypothetical protein [Kordiimonadaceae bacterium]
MQSGNKNFSDWKIKYLGWSGFCIHNNDDTHIFIDPPKGTYFPPEVKIIIFITHGHPEHLGGSLDRIKQNVIGGRTRIIASKTIVTYLKGICQCSNVEFFKVKPEQRFILTPYLSFEVFEWQHMPLLPPDFGVAVLYILRILKKFREAWRIIKMSLNGPLGPGRMLGYTLHLLGNKNIIIYGEGLHRQSCVEDISAIGHRVPGATLLVASEPEDTNQLPTLVMASGASEIFLYEPHSPWRDLFSLPHIDLHALKRTLLSKGLNVTIPKIEM